ncbi:PREDICTED: protein ENHANCED DISEASE RESISTANCE 2-like isoform X2 [Tarenaya hassleriana]|uniref:protein ENHANCED DISEASE RESISTANCE 2-like isoform X2 n=1 Tax=Tarenaya hassleriana TaxID=28532 RepID=UPI00053C101E|nr:PREDICTED: protein ENHANCED DISEASE RESISTANCE 2-like isoform X2 [Tarenaya hassleriana]
MSEEMASKKVVANGSEKSVSGNLGSSGVLGDRNDGGSSIGHSSGVGEGGEGGVFEYFGRVYHLGTNSIGHEYCHLRFLFIRGKYVEMYKRNPHENPGIKPIRRGVIGPTMMIEELGCRKVNHGDVYVIRFYNRLDETKKGEIACPTAGEARKWLEAFEHAKQQGEYELTRGGSTRNKLNMEADIDLEGHRPRVRRYARGLKKLMKIWQGPETLLRQSSSLVNDGRGDGFYEGDNGDAIEAHEWKCVRTINGVRIFEDVANYKAGRGVLVKAVAVVEANADAVFEVILKLDKHQRYEWDAFTGDLELVDSYDGNYDVVYCTYDPKYLSRWQSNRDFIFSRQWFRGQDGTYTILQFPATHKQRPPRSGYRRTEITPSTWEIRSLNTPADTETARCLVTQMLEIHSKRWCKWKNSYYSKFEKTIPYALLIQVAGLKEYIEANPAFKHETSATVVNSRLSDLSTSEYEDEDAEDQFYDATDSSSDDEESDEDDDEQEKKEIKVKLKNVSWAIASLSLKQPKAPCANNELDACVDPVTIDLSQFQGSLQKGLDDKDSNCWCSPSGMGFMIRGKTYLKDNAKVMGGEPLLKLIAVDWFKVDKAVDNIALHPKCLVQSEAAKKLPFILVINLQIPAKPNYCLVLYYAADRPVNKSSSLGKFVDGSDTYRDSRFKLIPSIVQGYWMVKRAVGTKACLLGKAVTCKYLRQDNFLEIDVDIGSSSVARSVIGLVLGYVTSLIVDLAILIEGKEESELPEYILGTVRLNRIKPDSAMPLEVRHFETDQEP